MDPIPCVECGHDATDFMAHNEELKAQNKELRARNEKLSEQITQMRVEKAEDVGDDAKVGMLAVRRIAVVLFTGMFCLTTCHLGEKALNNAGHTEVTRMVEAVNTAFRKCEEEAKNDEERRICFQSYKESTEELVDLVKTKNSGTVQNSMVP